MLPDDPKANIDPDIDLADDEVEEDSSLPSLEEDAPQGPLAAGVAAIQRYAKLAPKGPGVYRMIDAKGEVLYVGKAKSIRKRIVSYARQAPPMIAKHRGARNKPGEYYGPFASAQAVHRTITALERAFLIRSCSDP